MCTQIAHVLMLATSMCDYQISRGENYNKYSIWNFFTFANY